MNRRGFLGWLVGGAGATAAEACRVLPATAADLEAIERVPTPLPALTFLNQGASQIWVRDFELHDEVERISINRQVPQRHMACDRNGGGFAYSIQGVRSLELSARFGGTPAGVVNLARFLAKQMGHEFPFVGLEQGCPHTA